MKLKKVNVPDLPDILSERVKFRNLGIGILTGIISLLSWALISQVMIRHRLFFASNDDYPRLAIALGWSQKTFFFTEGYYWLPLPFWYYGAWHKVLSHFGWFVHWYIPAATCMMALACWGLFLLTIELIQPKGERLSPPRHFATVFATLALAITIPFTWRMTATGLAEPVFMAGMSWLGLLMVRFARRPTGLKWFGIFLLLEALMWTRYEGWPVAFLAWAVTCHLSHRGPGPRPRVQWQLLAGGAVFVMLPLWLMWIHSNLEGDALYFFKIPHIWAKLIPRVYNATTPWRIVYLTWLAVRQGWVILPLCVVGMIHGRRRPEFWIVALLALFLWLTYYEMAITNTFGWNPPDRFCVPALWMSAPIAAHGLFVILRPRKPRVGAIWMPWAMRTAIALAIFAQITYWNGKKWGGLMGPPEIFELADELSVASRDANAYAVIGDSGSLNDTINLFRIYMGVTRVVVEREWFPENVPIRGTFYYFNPRPLPGIAPARQIAGQNMYIFHQWPPEGVDLKMRR